MSTFAPEISKYVKLMRNFKQSLAIAALSIVTLNANAQREELIKFGDFESWVTRHIKESAIVGGASKVLMEVGPETSIDKNQAYVNMGGSPWATSNVYAKVCGVVKTNTSVYPDVHGKGKCAKLVTHTESAKAVGIVNITVLAAGSLYTGKLVEPVTSSKNPMSKLSLGVPFKRRPSALKFDYKVKVTGEPNRQKITGFSKDKVVPGQDYAQATCILQKRWEDADGKIHALRVGTMIHRFSKSVDTWQEGKTFPIKYGDISKSSDFKSHMDMVTGESTYYTMNSKGKNVPIIEEGWADANETPTHVIVKFDSSHGGAYIGSIGNTLWVDNVKFVFDE